MRLAFASICIASLGASSADSVRQVASLERARSVHTATTLATGQVLIAGGMAPGGAALASAELFDPLGSATRRTGSLTVPRHSHTATRLSDGRVVIAGGYDDDYLASVEVYDPATRRFRDGGELSEPRSGHPATLLPDGRILIAGGVGRGWTLNAARAAMGSPITAPTPICTS